MFEMWEVTVLSSHQREDSLSWRWCLHVLELCSLPPRIVLTSHVSKKMARDIMSPMQRRCRRPERGKYDTCLRHWIAIKILPQGRFAEYERFTDLRSWYGVDCRQGRFAEIRRSCRADCGDTASLRENCARSEDHSE